jgi:hypothetical protein
MLFSQPDTIVQISCVSIQDRGTVSNNTNPRSALTSFSQTGGGRPALQLAAGGAAVAIRLANGFVAQRGIVICSVGTLDGQDMMLRRIGLLPAPDTKPVHCEHYGDLLQVMYCDNLQRLSRGFYELMDHMAEALQLEPPSC